MKVLLGMRTAGKPGGRCPAILKIPMHEIGIGEEVVQKTEAGHESGPAMTFGHDLEILDFQQIAGPCALDVNRSRQRVNYPRIHLQQIGGHLSRTDLAVGGIAGLEDYLLERLDLERGRNVRMPAVVAFGRLLAQPLRAINGDAPGHRSPDFVGDGIQPFADFT
jgi:hypothetical protein